MTGNDVLEILNVLNAANIPVWIDGGWGIDALIGKQTREHDDLDVIVALEKVKDIIRALGNQGFAISTDELPTRFVLQDARDRQIDFHTVTFDAEGGGIQRQYDGSSFRYTPEGFNGKGHINGHAVQCLTAEIQAQCHYGYEHDEKDKHDLTLLQTYFGIERKG